MKISPTKEWCMASAEKEKGCASVEAGGPGVDAMPEPQANSSALGVVGGSVAGAAPPKPLICRLADLMKEWKEARDGMKLRKEDEASIAVECCMEQLYETVNDYHLDTMRYRLRAAPPQNNSHEPRAEGTLAP